jgi:hypothetical protein
MTSPRLDLGTLCVLDTCDNQLHHEARRCPKNEVAHLQDKGNCLNSTSIPYNTIADAMDSSIFCFLFVLPVKSAKKLLDGTIPQFLDPEKAGRHNKVRARVANHTCPTSPKFSGSPC